MEMRQNAVIFWSFIENGLSWSLAGFGAFDKSFC